MKKLFSAVLAVFVTLGAAAAYQPDINAAQEDILQSGENANDLLYKEGGYYVPSEGVETELYYFAMPEYWKTYDNAAPCAFWWTGPDACKTWQDSYLLRDAGADIEVNGEKRHVYYIFAAKGIETIIFNNGIDASKAKQDDKSDSSAWGKSILTENIFLEGLDKDEDPAYPDGLESFNNMIYITDEPDNTLAEYNRNTVVGGSWYYFHYDGTFDTTPGIPYLIPKVKISQIITVSKTKYTKEYGGKNFSLGAKTNSNGALSYKSSDKKVVTVSSKGKVTIKGCGSAVITIKAAETSLYTAASKKVTVIVKPPKLVITGYSGNRKKLTVKFKKQNNVSGYECKYNKNKTKTVSGSKSSINLYKVIKGTAIKIRAYKKLSDGTKLYGAYTKITPKLK